MEEQKETKEKWEVDARIVRKMRKEAEAALESGITAGVICGTTVKNTLKNLGLWERAGKEG